MIYYNQAAEAWLNLTVCALSAWKDKLLLPAVGSVLDEGSDEFKIRGY